MRARLSAAQLTAVAALLPLLLRVPWWPTPLALDESGYAAVATAWGQAAGRVGRHDYGAAWLDKPPLLVAAFESAAFGDWAVRLLGLLAALAVALGAAAVARELMPRAAYAPAVAAGLAAVFASCSSLRGPYTEAELLADVASVWSVALLLRGVRDRDRYRPMFAGAGALAAAALLTKQSFLDPGVVGVGLLLFVPFSRWRATVRDLASYLAGALGATVVVLGSAAVAGSSLSALGYALIGFRITAGADAAETSGGHLVQMLVAAGISGLALVAFVGLLSLARRREVTHRVLPVVWLVAALLGVAAGGSYWHHYLLQLVPVTAVLGAVAACDRAIVRGIVAAGAAAAVVVTVAHAPRAPRHSREATVGRYVESRAYLGDSVVTLYTAPGVYETSGLVTPYPYYWGTMVDDVPGAADDLVRLLSSPDRPTFVVRWSDRDRHGRQVSMRVRDLLLQDYKLVATVCGDKVYERRDVKRNVAHVPRCR